MKRYNKCFPGGDGSGAMTFLFNSRPDFFCAFFGKLQMLEKQAAWLLECLHCIKRLDGRRTEAPLVALLKLCNMARVWR